jgi:hypothetical protein
MSPPPPTSTRPAPPERIKPRTRRWLGLLALGTGLVLVLVFGLRAVHQIEFAKRVERGEIQVETLRGWMTLPYIAQLYGVPQEELRAALKLPATGNDARSLRVWFATAGIEPVAGRQAIEALILAYRQPPGEAPGE